MPETTRPLTVVEAEQRAATLAWHTCETCHAPFPVTQEELRELRAIHQLNGTELPPDEDLVGDVTECRACTVCACEGCGALLETPPPALAVRFEDSPGEIASRVLCPECQADPTRCGICAADPFFAPHAPPTPQATNPETRE